MNIQTIGNVYIIHSPNTDLVYIGSTFKATPERFRMHKTLYEKGRNYTRATRIFNAAGGPEFVQCDTLETLINVSKEDLRMREQYWIDCNPTAINGMRSIRRTKVEIKRQDPVNYVKNLFAQNGDGDLDEVLPKSMASDYVKKYRENNAEKLKERQRQYYLANKGKIVERYQANREAIKARQSEIYRTKKDTYKLVRENSRAFCPICAKSVQNIALHDASPRHQKNVDRASLSTVMTKKFGL